MWPVPGLPVIQLHVQKQQSHKTSAPGMPEMLEPAIGGWFLRAHKHPGVWILMHPLRRVVGGPMAARHTVELHTRGAHITRNSVIPQEDMGLSDRTAEARQYLMETARGIWGTTTARDLFGHLCSAQIPLVHGAGGSATDECAQEAVQHISAPYIMWPFASVSCGHARIVLCLFSHVPRVPTCLDNPRASAA